MARRNLVRSLLAASLMVVFSAVGMLAVPSPAGAHHIRVVPDYRVTVYETSFDPPVVYAKPGQTVQFDLAPGVSSHHTVTLDNGKCEGRPEQLCEETFEDPQHPPVFRFSNYGEYPYHDRYADDAGLDMSGRIVITDNPPTVQPTNPPPTTTSTTMSSTTTSRPVTTTTLPPTTSTTGPTTIRPFVIADTGPTTTTIAPSPAGTSTTGSTKKDGAGASAAGAKDKSKGKGDGKGKAASTDKPAPAALPEGSPIDVTFDPATLTPLPESSPTESVATTPDSGPEESAVFDLLGAENAADDAHLLIIAFGVLGFLVLLTGGIAWFHRSSRYFPA